jgi:hypothetical protein
MGSMRRIHLAVVTIGLLGCTPGVVPQRHAADPRVFSGTPRCAYEVLGTFSRASNFLREIESRNGDAVIHVKEEAGLAPGNSSDPATQRAYSGQVVRFTDPACKV